MTDPASGQDEILGLLFHENSKLRRSDERFGRRLAAFLADPRIREMASRPFKRYRGAERVALPSPLRGPAAELHATLARRRSAASLAGEPPDLATFGRILWCGAGITLCSGVRPEAPRTQLRASPSAGALYPLESYVLALDVAGLPPGLYHYDPPDHALERLADGDLRQALASAVPRGLPGATAVVALTALFRRTLAKYGERGYRFALMEGGHLAQNILLAATAADLPALPVGGFLDDEVARLLGVDGFDEAPVYLVALGGR